MTKKWEEEGCNDCRALWESGARPPELAVKVALHSRLHRCSDCGVYWEQLQRYANVIDENEAQANYPDAFVGRKNK